MRNKMQYDVHVIGAGVSGCYCAYNLAKNNLNVLISEEDKKIGLPKHCTGHISVRGMEESKFNYKNCILNKFYGVKIFCPNKLEYEIKKKEIQTYAVDRVKLDEVYYDNAIKEGAQFENKKITKRNEYKGKIIVGADGVNSTIARIENMGEINDTVIGYQEIIESKDIVNDNMISVYLSNKKYPGFFGWKMPLENGRAIIGFGSNKKINFKKTQDKLIEECGISKYKKIESFGGIIPQNVRRKISNNNVLLVGDAAGFAKATTGGGVYFATKTARIASECIIHDKINEYEKEVNEYRRILKIHRTLRKTYNLLDDNILSNFLKIGNYFGMQKIIENTGDLDYVTKYFR
jgi:digeranylgeranylglycerophospholipid reductase